jgi:DNA topoisomerase I
VLTIGLNRAVILLAEPSKGRRQAAQPLRTVGAHPDDGDPIQLFKGRYGPYVAHDGLFATVPGSIEPENLTLEAAVELLKAQEAKGKKRKSKRGKPAAKSKPAAKPKKAAAATAKPAARPKPKKKATGAAAKKKAPRDKPAKSAASG